MNDALREFGMRLARREGLTPLQPGQMRPEGYYMVNHASGVSRVARGAFITLESNAAAEVEAEGFADKVRVTPVVITKDVSSWIA